MKKISNLLQICFSPKFLFSSHHPIRCLHTLNVTSSKGRRSSIPPFSNIDILLVGDNLLSKYIATYIKQCNILKQLRVGIVERGKQIRDDEVRHVCINKETARYLKDLQVWEKLMKRNQINEVDSFYINDSTESIHFRNEDVYVGGPLAYVTEEKWLRQALDAELEGAPSVTIYNDALENLHDEESAASLGETAHPMSGIISQLSDGKHIRSKLVIATDSIDSKVIGWQDTELFGRESDLSVLLCTVTSNDICNASRHPSIGWLKFIPSGSITVLPVSSNCYSIVWNSTVAHVQHLTDISQEAFINDLNGALQYVNDRSSSSPPASLDGLLKTASFVCNAVGSTVKTILKVKDGMLRPPAETFFYPSSNSPDGKPSIEHTFSHSDWLYNGRRAENVVHDKEPPHMIHLASPIIQQPLNTFYTACYAKGRTALVGSAAHSRNSTPSVAFNLGIGDCMALLNAMQSRIACGGDVGDALMLEAYAKQRESYNYLSELTIDTIAGLYRSDGGISCLSRKGINKIANNVPFAKAFIAHILSNSN